MKYIRANSLKRLFSLKRRSFEDGVVGNHRGIFEEEDKDGCKDGFEIASAAQRPSWKCFSFEEIFVATNAFSSENLVGKGGYAEVYRGVLNDGEEIAVKRLTKTYSDERKEKDFLTEIGTIGHVCHPNVLGLLGCCIDNGLFLIFQFSSLGSVASRLHDANSPPMDWKTRNKIAIGTARGLHYLHKVCQRRIIHRDIKSSNILLTADFEPQISDFGLAKWLPSQLTHHSIAPIEGTFGHLAPEYFMHGTVDEKTDVFAFGVFLLEIISGRKPVDASHQSLHCWAKPLLNREEMEKLVDPRLGGSFDISQLKRLTFAASLCIRASAAWRPTMTEVLEVLMEGETDKERWKMPEEEQEEFWGFEDLEYECHSSFSVSPDDSISTASSLRERN
ncbi:putative receptor-like serine/threonine-protein kinase [Hibiscus syriacus]|uniref:Receptor-like serine/threonine-protein kinase n=1 Tax=Hibiscus syriacus TaxID=106335 RepID=A0A6A2WQV5_HIBSY|nr:probable receptor-like serine/threonine-protein kinase At5g57670 isoform X1 [Hibiscus syriacus]XP_039051298.1 probable receptor-like serine/threonine-protein kinase At5g57670 isoform X2 [Hibiscus syriacus]KAE8657985.1 putative receptor-like serine/threonine-protein kinase [Hibiscus syriacus]